MMTIFRFKEVNVKEDKFEELMREFRVPHKRIVAQEVYEQSMKYEADSTPEPYGYDDTLDGPPERSRQPGKYNNRFLRAAFARSGVDNYGGWR